MLSAVIAWWKRGGDWDIRAHFLTGRERDDFLGEMTIGTVHISIYGFVGHQASKNQLISTQLSFHRLTYLNAFYLTRAWNVCLELSESESLLHFAENH